MGATRKTFDDEHDIKTPSMREAPPAARKKESRGLAEPKAGAKVWIGQLRDKKAASGELQAVARAERKPLVDQATVGQVTCRKRAVRGFTICVLVGCGRAVSPTVIAHQPSDVRDDRCGLIAAAMQTDQIKSFACGTAATEGRRIVVDVQIEPPLTGSCASDVFVVYRRDQAVNTDALLQLTFTVHERDTWAVGASFVDPPNSPDDADADGTFEDTNYYCHVAGVRVTRTAAGWRAWHDPAL